DVFDDAALRGLHEDGQRGADAGRDRSCAALPQRARARARDLGDELALLFHGLPTYPSVVASMAPIPRRAARKLNKPPIVSSTSAVSSTMLDNALIEGEAPNLSWPKI